VNIGNESYFQPEVSGDLPFIAVDYLFWMDGFTNITLSGHSKY